MRYTLFAPALLGAQILSAQATPTPAYDVSAVKPHLKSDGMSWGAPKGEFRAINVGLKSLIASAWGVRPDQVAGEQAWVDDEHWDVTAKITEITPAAASLLSKQDVQGMNQALLAERFHVKVHIETREGTVFNLVPSKSGIKLVLLPPLREGQKDDPALPRGSLMMRSTGDAIECVAHGINPETLVNNLSLNLRQTVIDKTGIPAKAVFDVKLRYTTEDDPAETTHSDAPPLRTAIDEQLGLHLDAARGPIRTVVVDHAERPTDN